MRIRRGSFDRGEVSAGDRSQIRDPVGLADRSAICGTFGEAHSLLQRAAQIENAASWSTTRQPAYGQPLIRFEVTRLAPGPSLFALFFGCYLPIFYLIPFSVFAQPILTSSLCSFRHPINLPPPGVMPGHIRSASALQESRPAALTV
jgi:hypothetical protein